MKQKMLMIIVAFLVSCSQFPTQLGYVDETSIQSAGIVFSPAAEGAPGDTLLLTGYFEGDSIETVDCSLSTRYQGSQGNAMGMMQTSSDTVYGFIPVSNPKTVITAHAVSLSFVIPRDFFIQNPVNTGAVLAGTPFMGWSMDSIHSFLTTTDFSGADSTLCQLAAKLVRELTGKMVFHIKVNNSSMITRSVSIRYNSHIIGNKYVFVNKNPKVNWIGVYKVKTGSSSTGGSSIFEPGAQDTLLCLYVDDTAAVPMPRRFTDTISIDKGYSYKLMADSGELNGTITRDMSCSNSGIIGYEDYRFVWFYQSAPAESKGIDPQEQLIVEGGGPGGGMATLSPPTNCAIQHAKLWAHVSDSFMNETNRPVGISVYEMNVVFTYSEAYRKNPGQ